ncbi:O-Antigen ligase [Posidoniimonas corsicana]|uniref:O-Antigen ligase n=1 Tax=Posidoniimonas corsicana TaxID=1938618 RepID=A0A5C5V632_9BACT|nr:O-antigen ligase family protein [Posidoniimonas corsicana]TWT34008.1 O-Antigen ligase [Posidoniimonas corsicana]
MIPTTLRQRWAETDMRGWPLRLTDACLLGVLVAAPLFFGGRHDLGLLVYSGLVLTAASAWLMHGIVTKRRPAELYPTANVLVIAAPLLLMLQLVELPSWLVGAVSPPADDRLVAWGNGAPFGGWRHLSFDPSATRASLATLLTHAVLFLVVAQRVRSRDDVQRLVRWLGIASAGMALLALTQYLTGAEQILWCVPLTHRDPSRAAIGTFTNPNHCGHFIALGAGAVLVEAVRRRRQRATPAQRRRPGESAVSREQQLREAAWILALLATGVAILLTFSRGALLAYTVGLLVTITVLARAGWVGRAQLVRGAFVLVVCGVALSLFQYEQFSRKAGGVSVGELDELADTSDRMVIWRANLSAFFASPLVGYGAGTHSQVAPLYLTESSGVNYTHAESGYLQVATEAGLAGVLLLATAIAIAAAWCMRGVLHSGDAEATVLWAAISAALAVSLFHSIADFVWFIPSCLAPVVMLAAGAMRLSQLQSGQPQRAHGKAWGLRDAGKGFLGTAMAAVAVLLLVGPARSSFQRDAYDRTNVAVKRYNESLKARVGRDNAESEQRILESRVYYTDKMIEHLQAALAVCPSDAQSQLRLARQSLLRFELTQAHDGGGMGLANVRNTVYDAQFQSEQETAAWLRRAFGDDSQLLWSARHAAVNAVRLCPLQGEAYMILADLAFLGAGQGADTMLLVDQALRLNPHDGAVLFDAGKHKLLAGQEQQALTLWKQAGHAPGPHRMKLASVVSMTLPADEFVAEFDPDWRLTFAAYQFYKLRGEESDLHALATHALQCAELNEQTELPNRAAHNWWQAATIHQELGDTGQAVRCAEQAYRLRPACFYIRRGLAAALFRAERLEEADPHIRWCLARQPDDSALRRWLQDIAKHRLALPGAERRPRVASRPSLLIDHSTNTHEPTPPE